MTWMLFALLAFGDDEDCGCPVAHVAVGETHTCAATRGGQLFCWGGNQDGQLGTGSTSADQTRPVRTLLGGVTDVAAGFYHSCAVSGGALYCWGGNFGGVLGDGTQGALQPTPELVLSPLAGAAETTVGEQHTCARTTGGEVLCWGANYLGQVGNGFIDFNNNVLVPVPVVGLATGVVQISAGDGFHTCARDASGAVSCWGSDSIGQLGNGSFGSNFPTPQPVGLVAPAIDVTAGFAGSCAVLADHSLWCWGEGTGLGIPSPPSFSDVPVRSDIDRVRRVSMGLDRTCAITQSGDLYCWGIEQNSSIFTLAGFVVDSDTPVRVHHLRDVTEVAVGYAHTCAIERGGRLYCWGANPYGELGVGDTTDRTEPTRVHLRCE